MFKVVADGVQSDVLTWTPHLLQCTRLPGTRDLIDWPQASRDGYVLSNVSVVINAYTSGMLDILGVRRTVAAAGRRLGAVTS